jgi:uncharacterized lipoprotein YajG
MLNDEEVITENKKLGHSKFILSVNPYLVTHMKNIIIVTFSILLLQACSSTNNIIVIGPAESMSISGKGPGQDAAINPYLNSNSIATVKNLGKNNVVARIQKNGELIENITVPAHEKREVTLLNGYELYFDSDLGSKVSVSFRKS